MPKQQEDMISAFEACKFLFNDDKRDWYLTILNRLKLGCEITAYGAVNQKTKITPIPADDWKDGLRLVVVKENGRWVCHADNRSNTISYYNLAFKKADFDAVCSDIQQTRKIAYEEIVIDKVQPVNGYIRLQEACLLLATGEDWTQESIMEREHEQLHNQQYQKYLHALLNDKVWPSLSDAPGDVEYFEILKTYARGAQWRMAFLDKTPKQFLDHVNQSIHDYEMLHSQLLDAAHKIKNEAAEKRITLWGKPTTAGKNYSANDLEVIPLGALLNEKMMLWWFGSKFWYQGEKSAERKDKDWVDVTLLRSEVERLRITGSQDDNPRNLHPATTVKNRPTDEDIRDAARSVYAAAPTGDKPNISVAETQIREMLDKRGFAPATHRNSNNPIRGILEETEFSAQRNARGRRRAR